MTTGILLPPEVEADAGAVFAELRAAGWWVCKAEYNENTFGNWLVELKRGWTSIRLTKDRSRYSISGSRLTLMAAGLDREFENLAEFHRRLVTWVGKRNGER